MGERKGPLWSLSAPQERDGKPGGCSPVADRQLSGSCGRQRQCKYHLQYLVERPNVSKPLYTNIGATYVYSSIYKLAF